MKLRLEVKPDNGPSARLPLIVETRDECGSPWAFVAWVAAGSLAIFIIFALCAAVLKGCAA